MAEPVWARSMHATVSIDPAVIGATHLKAGTYDFILEGNQVVVRNDDNGKTVVEVQGQIMESRKKPESDEIIMEHDQIREIHFANKTKYVVVKG